MKKCENARKVKDIQTRLEEGDSVQTNMWMPKLRKHSTTIRELEKVRRTKSQTKDFEQCILEKHIWSIERKKRQELKVCIYLSSITICVQLKFIYLISS